MNRLNIELHWCRPTARYSALTYVFCTAIVLVAVGTAVVFRRLPHADLPLLFLTAVIIVAARWGLWPSIYSSVLSFLALNFFFTVPFYTFHVQEEGDFATLVFFLAMSGLTGNLAARMRAEAAKSRSSLARVSELLDYSRRMTAAATANDALQALVDRLTDTFEVSVLAYMADRDGAPQLRVKRSADESLACLDAETVKRVWQRILLRQRADEPGWNILPLVTAGGPIGMVAIGSDAIDDGKRGIADGLCDQTSVAVERTLLVDSLRSAQLTTEAEQLRSALLSSVSHDLRTPLASIIGSATSVLEYHAVLTPDDRHALLQTVVGEAQRLNRYIQNLLDMTRFGQRPFDLHSEWTDINDLISGATERLGAVLANIDIDIDVALDATVVKVNGALLEQVFVNLLDNAAGFSPERGSIGFHVFRNDAAVVIEVVDQGPGIAECDRHRVFDMFYRVLDRDRQRPGTGLGLAICKSVITAHGGTIEADSGPQGVGTTMRIRLPVQETFADEGRHGR